MYQRLRDNMKANPPKGPVEMPAKDVRFDDEDELDIEDPGYADALFNAGIQRTSSVSVHHQTIN